MSRFEARPIGLEDLPEEAANGPLFARPGWLACQEDRLELLGVFDEGGQLAAYCVGLRRKAAGIVPLLTPPRFTPYAPCWISEGGSNKSNAAGRLKRILDAMAEDLSRRPGVVALAFPPEIVDMQPFVWRGFKVVPRYTYRVALQAGEERIRADMGPKRRNDISRALRDGTSVEDCADPGRILGLVQGTFDRKGRGFERDLAYRIMERQLEAGTAFGKIALAGGQPAAAAFCACDGTSAYYLFGGHDPALSGQGAGALVLWECIREASARGLALFDFEGSMIPEVEAFFRDFGGDLVPYFVANRAPFLLESALKLLRRSQF